MQVCYVAGHEMMAIQKADEDPQTFQLFYLNFISDDYVGIEAAMKGAPFFALRVLEKMATMVGGTSVIESGGPDVPTPAGPICDGGGNDQP